MPDNPSNAPTSRPTRLLGRSADRLLDAIGVPAFTVDLHANVSWCSRAARSLLGDPVGRPYLDLIRPGSRARASIVLREQLEGGEPRTAPTEIVDRQGRTHALLVHSAALSRGSNTVAMLCIALPVRPTSSLDGGLPMPTRRQAEVLQLLAAGLDTDAIAQGLGISRETARNHIRGLLRQLGAHSRLEAVANGLRRGLVDLPPAD